MNTWKRQQEMIHLAYNNQTMLNRLLDCHTYYNRSKLEDDYVESQKYKEYVSKYPKDWREILQKIKVLQKHIRNKVIGERTGKYKPGTTREIDKWTLEKETQEILKQRREVQKENEAKKKAHLAKLKHMTEAKERKKRNIEYIETSKKWREARQERLRLAEKREKEKKEREAEKKRLEDEKFRQRTEKAKQAAEKFKKRKIAMEKEIKVEKETKPIKKTKDSAGRTRQKLKLEEWKRKKKEREEKEKKKDRKPEGKSQKSSKTERGREDHEDRKKQSRQRKAKVSGDEGTESDKGESNKYKKSASTDDEIETKAKDKKSSERSLGYHLSEEGRLEELLVSEEEEEEIPEVPEKDKTLSPETEKGGTETRKDVGKGKAPPEKGRRTSSEVRIGYHLSEEGKLEDLIVSEEEEEETSKPNKTSSPATEKQKSDKVDSGKEKGKRKSSQVRIGYHLSKEGKLEDLVVSEDEEEEIPEPDRKSRSATRKGKSEKVDAGKEKESTSKAESGRRKSSEVRIGFHLSEEGKLEDLIVSEEEEEEDEKVEDVHSDKGSKSDEKKDQEEKK
ncbi:uncharacterized protein CDAR_432341 [Caerostris darwini]|uniref:Uncharacterized protein n=1 Tax=Caerostris darwini TaxID=1538125 RepID=A0AAV4U330_9ARAC|nr:uncharacterized protein CDAR_432341 [Caerostris darwini]